MVDIVHLTPLQRKAYELLRLSGIPDEQKRSWFQIMVFLPDARVQRMIDHLEEEQEIKKGIFRLTTEEEGDLKRKYHSLEREAWRLAEEESRSADEVIEGEITQEIEKLLTK